MTRFDYSTPNQVNFQRIDPRLIKQASTSAGSVTAENILNEIEKSDILVREEATRRQAQANSDRTYNLQKAAADREAKKYGLQRSREKAAIDLAKVYRPYAEASGAMVSPEMDKAVLGKVAEENKIAGPLLTEYATATPERKKVIDAQLNKLRFFGNGEESAKFMTALQNLYERRNTPSKEQAVSAIRQKALSKGILPKDAAGIATSLTTELRSDASRLKAAEAEAEARNKRALEAAKLDVSQRNAEIKKRSKSSDTKNVDNVGKIFKRIHDMDLGHFDTTKTKDAVKNAISQGANPAQVMASIEYALDVGWLDRTASPKAMEEYINGLASKDGDYGFNKGYIPDRVTLGKEITAGDILARNAIARGRSYDKELEGLLGRSVKDTGTTKSKTPADRSVTKKSTSTERTISPKAITSDNEKRKIIALDKKIRDSKTAASKSPLQEAFELLDAPLASDTYIDAQLRKQGYIQSDIDKLREVDEPIGYGGQNLRDVLTGKTVPKDRIKDYIMGRSPSQVASRKAVELSTRTYSPDAEILSIAAAQGVETAKLALKEIYPNATDAEIEQRLKQAIGNSSMTDLTPRPEVLRNNR